MIEGIAQTIDMIDAERIDGAFFDEAKNGRVPGFKDLGILDANTN